MAREIDKPVSLQKGDALIIVDVQNDFIRSGTLVVPEGDKVISPLNRAIQKFQDKDLPIFFTRDWHPPDHCSFKENGGPWPPHCVRGTRGAEFAPELNLPEGSTIISKGSKKDIDEYSGFHGFDKNGGSLARSLKRNGVKRVFIGGLATDYCVLNTVLDVLKSGYEVYVLTDAIRAVNVKSDDGKNALKNMKESGAKLTKTGSMGGSR
jgi:nicotinamidase/pyrazinamidase